MLCACSLQKTVGPAGCGGGGCGSWRRARCSFRRQHAPSRRRQLLQPACPPAHLPARRIPPAGWLPGALSGSCLRIAAPSAALAPRGPRRPRRGGGCGAARWAPICGASRRCDAGCGGGGARAMRRAREGGGRALVGACRRQAAAMPSEVAREKRGGRELLSLLLLLKEVALLSAADRHPPSRWWHLPPLLPLCLRVCHHVVRRAQGGGVLQVSLE